MMRASSATVRSSPAETLKSSLRAAAAPVATTMPSAMSSMWVSVRVWVPSPKIGSGSPSGQRQALLDDVGDHVGDAGLVLGHLAGAVGVERPADRVLQPVLVVGGAHVHLAGELGEPVGRAGDRRVVDVRLGRRVLRRTLEDHRGRDVGEALDVAVERRADDAVVQRVVHLGEGVRQLVEVADAADDRREVDDVRAPRVATRACSTSRRSPWWTSQPSRIHTGASRWSETRTSQAGSPSRRRTTAAPIVPAPPVTRTRFMGAPGYRALAVASAAISLA
jgi:hypothetical protein